MSVSQDQFAAALLDAEIPMPAGIIDPQGRPDIKRFNVYRNNVVVGLTDALEEAFPVIRKLVGDEFFRDMGNIFVRAHPPKSPILARYGAEFAGFLENFPPAAELPYLPDVARLEQALRQSYHAGDATPIDPNGLQDIAPDDLMQVTFTFAPAVEILTSRWPIHAIWKANMQNGPAVVMRAEDVLITRPAFHPGLDRLPAGGFAFVQALKTGLSLDDAIRAAGVGFDLGPMLGLLFKGGAITEISR
ncbi:MAG: DNA-binding domain-containing protein [Deltaproteobacteria bacterium]